MNSAHGTFAFVEPLRCSPILPSDSLLYHRRPSPETHRLTSVPTSHSELKLAVNVAACLGAPTTTEIPCQTNANATGEQHLLQSQATFRRVLQMVHRPEKNVFRLFSDYLHFCWLRAQNTFDNFELEKVTRPKDMATAGAVVALAT